MRRREPVCLMLLLSSAAVSGSAQTYDLRGPAPKQGTIIETRIEMKMPEGTMTLESGGTVSQAKARAESLSRSDVEVLQTDGREVTLLRYRVAEDWRKDTFEPAGAPAQETIEDHALVGETVLVERTADGWSKTMLGRQPDAKQARWLREPYSDGTERYPEKPVAVGESWVIEGPELLALLHFGAALSAEGKATFTLDRVVGEAGDRRAIVSYRLEAKAKFLDDSNSPLEVSLGGNGKVNRSLKSHLDVSESFTGQQLLEGSALQEGTKVSFTLAGPIAIESSERIVASDSRAEVVRRGTPPPPPVAPVAASSPNPRPLAQAPPPPSQPSCKGTALACSARGAWDCAQGSGCWPSGTCSGFTSETCFGKNQFSCGMTPGCFWQAWSNTCGGTVTCFGKAQFQCNSIAGCTWNSTCSGTAAPCASLNQRKCGRQPGCRFE